MTKSRFFFILILFLFAFERWSEAATDVHGIVDIVFKNDYITPRGLLVTDSGLTIQILSGLSLNVYKNPNYIIQNVSLIMGIWNDLWTTQGDPKVGAWNEMDWYAGFEMSFCKAWKFRAIFIEFLSPPGNFSPENNAEFTLFYDDSHWNKPILINPYLRLFWAISGDSTVVVGRSGDTYYVEIGANPTYKIKYSYPIIFSLPTWISMGPASFWNGGENGLKCEKGHFGVFSTGFKTNIALNYIPKTLGDWYFDFGFQYYYLINKNLLQAQIFTLNLSSIKSAHRHVFVGFTGFGFEF